ncbi:MAG: hypothetical protein IKV87_07960 [Methanobrevibacter sp.]|nr:hypothetical protein [Methanobrevibacter sp.]
MSIFDSLLNLSNSHKYYKKNFNKLKKSNDELKDSNEKLAKSNEELTEENKNLNQLLEYYKGVHDSTLPGRLLTKEEVLSFDEKYYDEKRWDMYYQEMIEELLKMRDVNKILEIGPYKAPFVEGSDVIDIRDFSEYFPIDINKVIIHDCKEIPYPIEDKEYDLIIACQCVEHLGIKGEQVEIFKEFARISKKAIVSLPYKWHRPFARDHHMIDERVFDDWQGEFKHYYERKSKYTILRIYDFD